MFEPTFTVIFRIPSPRPPGIELEPDVSATLAKALDWMVILEKCPPVRRQFFSSQIGNSGASALKSMPGVLAPEEVCLSTEYRRRASAENPVLTMQKTPESDLQADVQKAALQSAPLFQKFRKAIRSREEVTSWYHSQSSMPMDEPPLSCHLYSEALCEGDLFVNVCSGGIKAWIWRGKAWVPIKEGDPHPHISGYCVSFLRHAEPSWVTKKTIVTYRSKRRR
ncbi:hypothetical protein EDD15DRAFT_2198847 [Pisolithus albus]|nr:hypothetical protein EDD15DRAFT_2198847 [Pisolithus albus]